MLPSSPTDLQSHQIEWVGEPDWRIYDIHLHQVQSSGLTLGHRVSKWGFRRSLRLPRPPPWLQIFFSQKFFTIFDLLTGGEYLDLVVAAARGLPMQVTNIGELASMLHPFYSLLLIASKLNCLWKFLFQNYFVLDILLFHSRAEPPTLLWSPS